MKKISCLILLVYLWCGVPAHGRAENAAGPAVKKSTAASVPAKPRRRVRRKLNIDPALLKPQPDQTRFKEPADLIELIPVLRDINRMIPRRFSLAEHDVTLDPTHMVIKHQFTTRRLNASPKNSLISLTYYSGVGTFGAQMDVPIFYSSYLGLTRWERYPMGNYTFTVTRDGDSSRSLFIRALTRF